MIARCPECKTRYRLAREKIGERGARIRCSRCQTVFRVKSPGPELDEVAPAPAAPPKPKSPRFSALVAEADSDKAKEIRDFLASWRIGAEVVGDGSKVLLQLHRKRPDLVILGGHLPGLSAPVIAEIVRRTSELKDIRLIRVAPLDEPVGAPEFEADYTLEPGDLTEGLAAPLREFGLGEPPAAGTQKAPQRREPVSSDSEVANAERLARIIVSDIVLYNEAKFAKAVASGDVVAAMGAELDEASMLFNQRIPKSLRANRDFLVEELRKRAK